MYRFATGVFGAQPILISSAVRSFARAAIVAATARSLCGWNEPSQSVAPADALEDVRHRVRRQRLAVVGDPEFAHVLLAERLQNFPRSSR